MNKHTPTPYHIGKARGMGHPQLEISSEQSIFWIAGVGAPHSDRQTAEANGEFIIRACNAHDALVSACEAASHSRHDNTCKRWAHDDKLRRWATDEGCDCHVGQARLALALVKEGQA